MNLDYIKNNDMHEKYVLGKLGKEEKTVYEQFLKENEQAQRELQETRDLINGLREIGSDSMRKEIDRQVEEIRSPKTDWTMIYKAAAVLFIFVLLPSIIYLELNDTPVEKSDEENDISLALEEEMDSSEEEELIAEAAPKKKESAINDSRIPKKTKILPEANVRSKPTESIEKERPAQESYDEMIDDDIFTESIAETQSAERRSSQTESLDLAESKDIAGIKIQSDKNESAIEINKHINALGGNASGSGGIRSRAPVSKQKSFVSSFNEMNKTKSYSYNINNDYINIALVEVDSRAYLPDSFSIKIVNKKQDSLSMIWELPHLLFNAKKDDIILKRNKNAILDITILNKFYKAKLDSVTINAMRIK